MDIYFKNCDQFFLKHLHATCSKIFLYLAIRKRVLQGLQVHVFRLILDLLIMIYIFMHLELPKNLQILQFNMLKIREKIIFILKKMCKSNHLGYKQVKAMMLIQNFYIQNSSLNFCIPVSFSLQYFYDQIVILDVCLFNICFMQLAEVLKRKYS